MQIVYFFTVLLACGLSGSFASPVPERCIQDCKQSFGSDTWSCTVHHHASERRQCERQRYVLLDTCLQACAADCPPASSSTAAWDGPTSTTSAPLPTQTYAGTVEGCDYTVYNLECPSPATITDGTITYGRWDDTICPPATAVQTTDYYNETYPLPTQYTGASTAQIDASGGLETILGKDPIVGVVKQVEISFTCV